MKKYTLLLLIFFSVHNLLFSTDYYSIANGNWSDANSWSTSGYSGDPASDYPDGTDDIAYIGSEKTISLDQDVEVGLVNLEASGRLNTGENVISGDNFQMNAYAVLDVAHPEGINVAGPVGAIQTGLRNFNVGENNTGIFIFSGACASTGTAIPGTIERIDFNLNPGQTIEMLTSFSVNQDVTINTGVVNIAGMNINLKGDWINDAEFIPGNSIITFNGIMNQKISGDGEMNFVNITVNKTTGNVIAEKDIRVEKYLRLNATTGLDIASYTLTIGPEGEIYSDDWNGQDFTNQKSIIISNGGLLVKEIADDIELPATVLFPISSAGPLYSPVSVRFMTGSIFSGAALHATLKPQEHPSIINTGVALMKYWTLGYSGNITLGDNGVNVNINYADDDVDGDEDQYAILQYADSQWMIDPGFNTNIVEPSDNEFTATKVLDPFTGDWTAGEMSAIRNVYYSRKDGNYSTPDTWSRESHDGAASVSAPSNELDLVLIGNNNTVTLTSNVAPAYEIHVNNTGTLLTGEFIVPFTVNTFRVNAGGTLGIGAGSGIKTAGTSGNIQSEIRIFSNDGIYKYTGNGNQQTGDALPGRVSGLIIEKNDDSYSVALTKSVAIGDSLVINSGTFDQTENMYTFDGESSGKTLIMRGGKMKLYGGYPDNYLSSEFSDGEIEFAGTDALTIPSAGTIPAVGQFNDLTISGARGSNAVTFAPEDTIRIHGKLTIRNLEFGNLEGERIITDNSTLYFNGEMAQALPRMCKTDSSWIRLDYYNLVIANSDTISFTDTNHVINNTLTIEPGAVLAQNGQLIEVRGAWINNGGSFVYDTSSRVDFKALAEEDTVDIHGGESPFYMVKFYGPGVCRTTGEMHIDNNLSIHVDGNFSGNDDSIYVKGLWINRGNFLSGQSTVFFDGDQEQEIYILNGNTYEEFYNLVMDNNSTLIFDDTEGYYLNILNELIFHSGVINANSNNRFVSVGMNSVRPGTGHVNGNLRILVPENNTDTLLFPVGVGGIYRPVEVAFEGNGGDEGYLLVYSEATNKDFFESAGGCGLDWTNSVQKRWFVDWFEGEEGTLGIRTIYAKFGYNENDVTINANPLLFEVRRFDGTEWHHPEIGAKTGTSVESYGNDGLGYFVVGQSFVSGFFSIADGNWSDASSWSTEGFDGPAASAAPGPDAIVRIGNNNTITLDDNITLNADASLTVENTGYLNCQDMVISGNGTFNLSSGGTLQIGSAEGISASGQTGNIQTWVRDFNIGGHNSGNFVFSGADGQITGDGLPDVIASLNIDGAGTVNLSKSVEITGDLTITSGTLDVSANNYNITLGGNWINNAGFNHGSGDATVTFNGTSGQDITNPDVETFNILAINKASGIINVKNHDLYVDAKLDMISGVVNTRENDLNLIVNYTGYIYSDGAYVDGKLTAYVNPGSTGSVVLPVGSGDDNSELVLTIRGEGGSAGYLTAIATGEDHADISGAGFDMDKNVQRYWTLMPDDGLNLGDRTFDIMLKIVTPDDIRNDADTNDFIIKHYLNGTWEALTKGDFAYSSVTGMGYNVLEGDFAIGIPGGEAVDESNMDRDDSYSYIYPNPISSSAVIEFSLSAYSHVELTVYDMSGRKLQVLVNEDMDSGSHTVNWAPEFNSGTYYYILKTNEFESARKFIINR